MVKKIVEKKTFAGLRRVAVLALCVLFFAAAGCGTFDDSPKEFFWEIPPNSRNAVINRGIDGIEFTFCLLNEKGEPATKFKQGENFSFYFAMTNHSKDKLHFLAYLLADLREDGFSQVISQKSDTIGFPISRGICYSDFRLFPLFEDNNRYEVVLPWCNPLETGVGINCFFESFQQQLLPKGEYYTVFTRKFPFYVVPSGECDPPRYIGPLTFKINFKIE